MTYAEIRFRNYPKPGPDEITNDEFRSIQKAIEKLPGVIADIMSCPDAGGYFTTDDVAIEVVEFGSMDVSKYNLELRIESKRLPTRLYTLDERSKRIQAAINEILVDRMRNSCVRIKLVDDSSADSSTSLEE